MITIIKKSGKNIDLPDRLFWDGQHKQERASVALPVHAGYYTDLGSVPPAARGLLRGNELRAAVVYDYLVEHGGQVAGFNVTEFGALGLFDFDMAACGVGYLRRRLITLITRLCGPGFNLAMRDRYLPNNKQGTVPPNHVFVFGSTLGRRYGKGASLIAMRYYRATAHLAEGLTGNAYGIPVLDECLKPLPISSILESRDRFFEVARAMGGWKFIMSRVGTGLAQYGDTTMMAVFSEETPENVILPEQWQRKVSHSGETICPWCGKPENEGYHSPTNGRCLVDRG